MMIYFIILGILGIGSLVDILILNERVKKVLYILSILMLVVFFGTRGYLGYDWYSYKPNFEKTDNIAADEIDSFDGDINDFLQE